MAQQTNVRSSYGTNRAGAIDPATDTTDTDAKNAGSAVGSTGERLKSPALAAGVGLAGLVGGIAVGRATKNEGFKLPRRRRSAAKRASKKLSSAAKNVGTVAEQTGQVAERVRVVSEAVAGKDGNQTAPRRSPLEVLLEGLTRRSLSRG